MNFKPCQFAMLDNPIGYHHPVEVMSFITPDNTYMVRRVVSHPGTLEEVHVNRLTPMSWRPGKVTYLEVSSVVNPRGRRLPFPVDMLRYDCAAPLNFKLEPRIVGGYDTGWEASDVDTSFGFEGLVVAIASPAGRVVAGTVERWNSFSWGVKYIATEVLPRTPR